MPSDARFNKMLLRERAYKLSLDRVTNGTAFPFTTSGREAAARICEQASKHGFLARQLPKLE